MKRVAVVDIGTQSILYLLTQVEQDGKAIPTHQKAQGVRLGRGIADGYEIQEERLVHALRVLNHYKMLARTQRADRIVVVGTQVFRRAANREAVSETIRRETRLAVEILSEEKEAKWGYRGAVYGRSLDQPVLVVDIGGGSTECIAGDGGKILKRTSVDLGVVGLTERFLHHDPPLPTEYEALEEHVAAVLAARARTILTPGQCLIGVGGTVTSLAAMEMKLRTYDPDRVDGYRISLSAVHASIDRLKRLPLSEIEKLPGLPPHRADIILAGIVLLKRVMVLGEFGDVRVSDRGLRFGIALRELFNLSETSG